MLESPVPLRIDLQIMLEGERLVELLEKFLNPANRAAMALNLTIPAMSYSVVHKFKFTLASFAQARRVLLRRDELGA